MLPENGSEQLPWSEMLDRQSLVLLNGAILVESTAKSLRSDLRWVVVYSVSSPGEQRIA